MRPVPLVAACIAACLFPVPLDAQTPAAAPLHVAFHNSTASRNAMAAAAAPTAQGTVVNTAAEVWNNLQNTSAHTFTNVALNSATGGASGATISGNTGYTGTNSLTLATKDSVMMDGWYGLFGGESMTVSNLPAAVSPRYHVIVYGNIGATSRVMNYTIGGATKTINSTGAFTGGFIEGTNHVVFTGLSGNSFTLGGNTSGARSAVCGISIISGDPLAITSFTADDQYIAPGASATLSWNVTTADSVTISPAVGNVAASGSAVVSPTATTTYTITATRGMKTITQTIRIGVGPDRPNIVMFLVDDMGWQDTSVPFYYDANGNPVVTGFNQRYRTPHMQALADDGVKFTNAYSCSVCSPTRASLMTGQSPARHRVTQWTLTQNVDPSPTSSTLKSPPDWNVNGLAPDDSPVTPRTWRPAHTLPGELANAGYHTIHVGKAHFAAKGLPGEDPRALGFDVNIAGHAAGGPGSFLGTANYKNTDPSWDVPGLEQYHGTNTFLTEALTLEANKAVTKAVDHGQPFFLYMSHYAIHVPIMADSRFSANYTNVSHATERAYATMIEGMDKSLGDIRTKLEQLGVAENTIIIFYSDNGGYTGYARGTTPAGTGTYTHNKPLRSGKGSAYEGGIRVPAIAAWAKADSAAAFQQTWPIAPGTRNDKPLIIEDWMPSILHLAGITPPVVDGRDITPYLGGDPAFRRTEPLLFHYPHIVDEINISQGFQMHSALIDGDWKVIHYYEGSIWQLYNLRADPGEASNLAASRPDLVMKLGRQMIRMLVERNANYPVNKTSNVPQRPLLPNNSTVDSDSDGRTDLQEDPNRNGIVDPAETNPDNGDSDGDGTGDGAEARLGLDPNDPSAAFRSIITPQPAVSDAFRLTWPSRPGTFFTIRAGTNLATWPETIIEHHPAADAPATTTSFDIPVESSAKKFFRVELE
ncbi:MAG: sulfatase-like hydrolase/transferase [Verrucomicrobiota bacterium]